MRRYVLVVDDDDDLRDLMCLELQRRGIPVVAAATPQGAVDHLTASVIAVMITDHDLKGEMTGLDLCQTAIAISRATICIVVSGSNIPPTAVAEAGASALFQKPCDVHEIVEFLYKACPLLRAHLHA